MGKLGVLLHKNDEVKEAFSPSLHPFEFWESKGGKIIILQNLRPFDLINQVEVLMKHGYVLSGGIQLIRRDDGDFNACATLLAPE